MSSVSPVLMSDSIASISKAMIEFHKKCPKIPKQARNPHLKSRYADLSTILEIIQPILNECELLVQQHPTADFGLTTIVSHASGEWISSEYPMQPVEAIVEKAFGDRPALRAITPQSIGSVITYQRRYALGAILALNIDDDNDAQIEPVESAAPSAPTGPKKSPQELMAEAAARVEAAREVTAAPAKADVVPTLAVAPAVSLVAENSAQKIFGLCDQLGIDAAGIDGICAKRGVKAVRELTQEQADTIITNLAAMAANAVASGGHSEAGQHVASNDGPCTDQQVSEIKAGLTEWEQSKKGVTADFIARLNGAGFAKISDMNFNEASKLKAAIEMKNIVSFFDAMLATASAG